MSNLFKVSQSKTNTWRRCRRAYWFKYVEKLRRKFVGRPLRFGRIVHDMAEAHDNGDDPMRVLKKIEKEQGAMFRSQREELGDLITDIRYIMTEYFEHWKNSDVRPVRMKNKSAEFSFEVEIADGIIATGKIDNVVKSKQLRWLGERKTFGSMPNDDHRWRNLQPAVYIKIMKILKLPEVDGMFWDYIRSKPPTRPKVLKSGKMSARALDTLPSVVVDSLKEAGVNPRDKKFATLIASAGRNRSSYFQRIYQAVKPKVVDTLFDDFVSTAKEMKSMHGKAKDRNIGRHCDWCEFEPLCRAELQGLDIKFITKKEYEVSDYKNQEEPDFEG